MFRLHHIGCLVDDLESSKKNYRKLFGFSNISDTIHVPSQKVFVCFIEIGNDIYLELIQPEKDSPLLKYRQKNVDYYHLSYLVKNIDAVVDDFQTAGSIVITSFASEGFDHRKAVFLLTPERQLIELIEDKS